MVVKTYEAQGGAFQVGAFIDVVYVPHGTDPTGASVHWIQVVTDNHKIGPGGGHGVAENIVDNAGAADPYYPAHGSGSAGFYDETVRTDGDQQHNWNGEVWLAKENGPQNVTIWTGGGIQWGWINKVAQP